jgi:hypothetical protein
VKSQEKVRRRLHPAEVEIVLDPPDIALSEGRPAARDEVEIAPRPRRVSGMKARRRLFRPEDVDRGGDEDRSGRKGGSAVGANAVRIGGPPVRGHERRRRSDPRPGYRRPLRRDPGRRRSGFPGCSGRSSASASRCNRFRRIRSSICTYGWYEPSFPPRFSCRTDLEIGSALATRPRATCWAGSVRCFPAVLQEGPSPPGRRGGRRPREVRGRDAMS